MQCAASNVRYWAQFRLDVVNRQRYSTRNATWCLRGTIPPPRLGAYPFPVPRTAREGWQLKIASGNFARFECTVEQSAQKKNGAIFGARHQEGIRSHKQPQVKPTIRMLAAWRRSEGVIVDFEPSIEFNYFQIGVVIPRKWCVRFVTVHTYALGHFSPLIITDSRFFFFCRRCSCSHS